MSFNKIEGGGLEIERRGPYYFIIQHVEQSEFDDRDDDDDQWFSGDVGEGS